jgi:hypothetical protein
VSLGFLSLNLELFNLQLNQAIDFFDLMSRESVEERMKQKLSASLKQIAQNEQQLDYHRHALIMYATCNSAGNQENVFKKTPDVCRLCRDSPTENPRWIFYRLTIKRPLKLEFNHQTTVKHVFLKTKNNLKYLGANRLLRMA